ncbi:hypothetical protein VTO42DRAFT_8513 [Malbranchea cinnamomea]
MEASYLGPSRRNRSVVPYMRKRGQGIVVNVGSGTVLEGRGEHGYRCCEQGCSERFLSRVLEKEVALFNVRKSSLERRAPT